MLAVPSIVFFKLSLACSSTILAVSAICFEVFANSSIVAVTSSMLDACSLDPALNSSVEDKISFDALAILSPASLICCISSLKLFSMSLIALPMVPSPNSSPLIVKFPWLNSFARSERLSNLVTISENAPPISPSSFILNSSNSRLSSAMAFASLDNNLILFNN